MTRETMRPVLDSPPVGEAELKSIIETVTPVTEGYSGARLRHLCEEAKRIAIKNTGFKRAAAPGVADMLAALRLEKHD